MNTEPIPTELHSMSPSLSMNMVYERVSEVDPTLAIARSISFHEYHRVLDDARFPVKSSELARFKKHGIFLTTRMEDAIVSALAKEPILYDNPAFENDNGRIRKDAVTWADNSLKFLGEDIHTYTLSAEHRELLLGLVDAASLWGRAYLNGYNFNDDANISFDVLVSDCTEVRRNPSKMPTYPYGYVRHTLLQFLKTRLEESIMTHLSVIKSLVKESDTENL